MLFEISPCEILSLRMDCCSWIVLIICSRSEDVNWMPARRSACLIALSVIVVGSLSPNSLDVEAPSAAMTAAFAKKLRLVFSEFNISK
jgi:hypothetical protein